MFFKILLLFFFQCLYLNNNDSPNQCIEKNKKEIKKRHNVDIEMLREMLITELVNLLQKIEVILKRIGKHNIDDTLPHIIAILHWVNTEIQLFLEDPTLFDRKKINISLEKITEYDSIINNMKKIQGELNGRL